MIGSEAWRLDESTRPEGIPADHTTGWRVYVKGIEGGPDITTWLKKVQFKLFHTYTNPLRSKLESYLSNAKTVMLSRPEIERIGTLIDCALSVSM